MSLQSKTDAYIQLRFAGIGRRYPQNRGSQPKEAWNSCAHASTAGHTDREVHQGRRFTEACAPHDESGNRLAIFETGAEVRALWELRATERQHSEALQLAPRSVSLTILRAQLLLVCSCFLDYCDADHVVTSSSFDEPSDFFFFFFFCESWVHDRESF